MHSKTMFEAVQMEIYSHFLPCHFLQAASYLCSVANLAAVSETISIIGGKSMVRRCCCGKSAHQP